MMDAILHLPVSNELPAHLADDNGSPALSDPQARNAAGDRLHYVRLTAEQLAEWRPYATVLAEAPYTGTGTAERVYQQLQDDPDALALYTSVYDTTPHEIDDGEGGTVTVTPPFKFGMLAESALPVPSDITPRQARLVLAKHGLLTSVSDAIAAIEDEQQRQVAEIEWEYATRIERSAPWVTALYAGLGLDKADVDSLFIEAATL
tara:strand:+ start:3779 stop:4393 length:615 start_codon:yes stop_codon:yes gene_type:complete